jgi:Na+-transporting methylmalonyl-CoA/oxaloacetate decarboxylase gamma subunit
VPLVLFVLVFAMAMMGEVLRSALENAVKAQQSHNAHCLRS